MFSHSQKVRRLLITGSVLVVCVRVHDDVRKTVHSDSESLWTTVMGSAELSSFMSCQAGLLLLIQKAWEYFETEHTVLIDICYSIFAIYL